MAVPGVAPQNAVTLLFLRVALLLGMEQVHVLGHTLVRRPGRLAQVQSRLPAGFTNSAGNSIIYPFFSARNAFARC